jgi:hypothetical protein
MTDIIEKLNIPITDKSEIPSGFAALTFPIELDQEEIIRSIWSTLRTTEALVSLAGNRIQFWRRVKRAEPSSRQYKRFVKATAQ